MPSQAGARVTECRPSRVPAGGKAAAGGTITGCGPSTMTGRSSQGERSGQVGSSAAINGGRSWPGVLGALTAGDDLDPADAGWAMARIMEGTATDAQVAAFGVALKMKGVTGVELEALASTMLDFSRRVPTSRRCVDIVGTGGDRQGTVNISTMSAIVVSACGVPVVKHGNRAATSRSGGADVLEALGVAIDLGPEEVQRIIDAAGRVAQKRHHSDADPRPCEAVSPRSRFRASPSAQPTVNGAARD